MLQFDREALIPPLVGSSEKCHDANMVIWTERVLQLFGAIELDSFCGLSFRM